MKSLGQRTGDFVPWDRGPSCSKGLCRVGGGDSHGGTGGKGELLQTQLGPNPGGRRGWEEALQVVQWLVHLVSCVWPCIALEARRELLGMPLAVSTCLVSE